MASGQSSEAAKTFCLLNASHTFDQVKYSGIVLRRGPHARQHSRGADYSGIYDITTSGDALILEFVTQSQQKNVGWRVYLLDDDNTYKIFNLKNQEFTFDVDMSQLPCGINGALYLVEMDADGGMSRFSANLAGARYGTGYCDTQCPHDIKFINGAIKFFR
ncbi:hypothetical protein ACEPAG_3383 [Sanghuangporus baumii]